MEIKGINIDFFKLSMWYRIAYGALRVVLAVALLNVVNVPLSDLLYRVMAHELVEDPNDLLYRIVNAVLQAHPVSVSYFLSVYLLFWGITDILLSASLLRHKIWAFPVSMTLIGGFVIYEVFRYTHTHSTVLLVFIFVDLAIFWLIGREYRRTRARIGDRALR